MLVNLGMKITDSLDPIAANNQGIDKPCDLAVQFDNIALWRR